MFTHFLCTDVVRVHSFCTTLNCEMGDVVIFATLQAVVFVENINQFGERRGDIHTFVVLDALQALAKDFFHNHCVLFEIGVVFFQVQEQCHERGLTIGGHQGVDLVLDCLDTAMQFRNKAFLNKLFRSFLIQFTVSSFDDACREFFVASTQVFAQMANVN